MNELTALVFDLYMALDDGQDTADIETRLADFLDTKKYEAPTEAARLGVLVAQRMSVINRAKISRDGGWPEAWTALWKGREELRGGRPHER